MPLGPRLGRGGARGRTGGTLRAVRRSTLRPAGPGSRSAGPRPWPPDAPLGGRVRLRGRGRRCRHGGWWRKRRQWRDRGSRDARRRRRDDERRDDLRFGRLGRRSCSRGRRRCRGRRCRRGGGRRCRSRSGRHRAGDCVGSCPGRSCDPRSQRLTRGRLRLLLRSGCWTGCRRRRRRRCRCRCRGSCGYRSRRPSSCRRASHRWWLRLGRWLRLCQPEPQRQLLR